jgi:hypothetical protein
MFDKYQSLRDTMTAMQLPQLQQYAAMHKDDPYVVTMALSIADTKKKAITAMQGQAGMQPTPKVADTAIAGMNAELPEDVGIGLLPAQNLQSMAGGGIVAFDEGGEVPRYNEDGLVRNPFAVLNPGDALDAARRWWKSGKPLAEYLGASTKKQAVAPNMETLDNAPFPEAPAGPAAGPTEQDILAAMGKTPAGAVPPGPGEKPPVPPQAPRQVPPAAAASGLPGLITTPEGIQKAMAAAQAAQSTPLPKEITGGIADLQQAEQALADQNVAGIKAEQAARGPALQAYEKELLKKAERTDKEEANLLPLIAFETGAAILAGTSPQGAVNIGAGLQVGIASYRKGAAKIEDARDKMAEGLAKIEEVRRNESRMDAKELRDAEAAAKKPLIDAKKLMLSAYEKNWGLDRADAKTGVELLMKNQIAMFEQGEQTKRTAMTVQGQKEIANMLPGETRTAMFFGKGDTPQEKFLSGMKVITEATADKTGMAAVKLLTETNTKRAAAGDAPITMQELLASAREYNALMYPKETSTPPKGAQLLQQ